MSNNSNGFLVAKGRFISSFESQLEALVQQGISTTDSRIYELKKKCDNERKFLEKKHVKQLSFAILESISKFGVAVIRCIGKEASYNASKAIAIATNKSLVDNQIKLNVDISFDEGNLGSLRKDSHVKNVTAILYTVRGING
jgi:stage V sporulation protein SpoVS